MFMLYDLINLVFIAAYLPVFLLKKKMHPGFERRLGRYPKDIVFSDPVWIHAVSVGEMINMRRLFAGLTALSPDTQFVLSTVTPTGNTIASGIARKNDVVTYLPLDISGVVRRVLDRINPRLFIIAETEFWPNLLSCLYRRRVPVIIVNGRISDRSIAGYVRFRRLLAPLLRTVSLWCMQTQADADRVIRLGARPESVKVTGNMKFDQRAGISRSHHEQGASLLGLQPHEKLLVAGSTHPGEEDQVMAAFAKINLLYPFVRLLIAPRHPQRAGELESCIRRYGFEPVRVSKIKTSSAPKRCVFILDTIGELLAYYAPADMVFVGGSLIKHGGQNFLEPAFLGKPVMVGPYLFNFRDIAAQFLDRRAVVLVHNSDEMVRAVKTLLTDVQEVQGLVQRAQGLIQQNVGATERNLAYIKEFMRTGKT
ncbi:MAG: 3-deoxy-D-manno-octulosonic acid transferase [Candidatus Omnitrophota bacterium]